MSGRKEWREFDRRRWGGFTADFLFLCILEAAQMSIAITQVCSIDLIAYATQAGNKSCLERRL